MTRRALVALACLALVGCADGGTATPDTDAAAMSAASRKAVDDTDAALRDAAATPSPRAAEQTVN